MSLPTASLALDKPLLDDRFTEEPSPILHTAFNTERLDPSRLDTAHGLPVRQFRVLSATPRQFVHASADDGTQQVHSLQVDASVVLELDLPPGSRYRLTSDHPEGLYVDHEPAAVNAVFESAMGGPLRIVSRGPFDLTLVWRRLPAGTSPVRTAAPAQDDATTQSIRRLLDLARALWIAPLATPRRRTPAAHVLEVVEQVLAAQPYGVLHPSDFAKPAGISVRSLERALQRAYGMGPKRWITTTRLNTAHRHLRDPGGEDRTVAQIARRCGFLHAGRFSQAYRALFGDYPHDVLAPPLSPSAPRRS